MPHTEQVYSKMTLHRPDLGERDHERHLRRHVRLLLLGLDARPEVLLARPRPLPPAGHQDFPHRPLGPGS